MSEDAPAGFELFTRPSPLMDPWRPLYACAEADRMILGVRLRDAHTNSRATAHGGLIAALADQAMGMSCAMQLRAARLEVANLWTSSLTVDYLDAAQIGQWMACNTVFVRIGKTLCHAECDIAADGQTIARARGAFRITLAKT